MFICKFEEEEEEKEDDDDGGGNCDDARLPVSHSTSSPGDGNSDHLCPS